MAKINSRRAASAQCRLTRLDGIAITVRPISELKLNPQNPRAHSPRQIRQLAESIRTFGFNVPILLDTNSQVIAGHGRVLAARRLGLPEVPTIRLSHLSEAQAQAFTIADNRLTENSTWDDKLLAEQLKALSLLHLDFSLEVVGFDTGEIDLRIESLEGKPDVNDDPADQIPAIRARRRQQQAPATVRSPGWRANQMVAGTRNHRQLTISVSI